MTRLRLFFLVVPLVAAGIAAFGAGVAIARDAADPEALLDFAMKALRTIIIVQGMVGAIGLVILSDPKVKKAFRRDEKDR